jgi:hypothetical protein
MSPSNAISDWLVNDLTKNDLMILNGAIDYTPVALAAHIVSGRYTLVYMPPR